eukprot:501579-Prorocentrum_minimum.AAC.2
MKRILFSYEEDSLMKSVHSGYNLGFLEFGPQNCLVFGGGEGPPHSSYVPQVEQTGVDLGFKSGEIGAPNHRLVVEIMPFSLSSALLG